MTNREKNYLLDMLWNNFNRSELDYYYYLNQINSNKTDTKTFINAIVSLVDMNSHLKLFRNVLDLLNCSQFDDNKLYNSKSQLLLSNRSISPEQDDLIYSYIMFVLNNKG